MRSLVDLILAIDDCPPPRQPRKLTKMSIFFRNMDGTVRHMLDEFYPRYADTERPYHDQAEAFFRSRCTGASIQRAPKHNGGLPDLVITMPGFVGGSLIVEIKARLSSRSARDRLIGQVLEYHRGGHRVLVLLCGNVSLAHVQDVNDRVAAVAPSALAEGSILVVDRTVRALVESRRQEQRHAESHRRAMTLLREMRKEGLFKRATQPPTAPPQPEPPDPTR